MPGPGLDGIVAFLAVSRERSFTRAAAQLGVSQSALSQTVRGLEARLGLRLLTRTTRSVSPTEAGEHLLRTAGPRIEEIEAELVSLNSLRDKPSGTIRITAHDHAVKSVLWPGLQRLLPEYPDIKAEVVIDYGLTDIAASSLDAGIRTGELIAQDMVAVRIGPDLRSAVVGHSIERPQPHKHAHGWRGTTFVLRPEASLLGKGYRHLGGVTRPTSSFCWPATPASGGGRGGFPRIPLTADAP